MSAPSKLAIYSDDSEAWRLIEADALLTLAKLPDACVDAIVCDPPYGVEIKNEAWDGAAIRHAVGHDRQLLSTNQALERWTQVWATQARRVLKPGGYMVAFGAPRTFHRLVSGVEDAGLEIRDQLLWLFGQGLPKSPRLPGGCGLALKPAYEPLLLCRAPLVGKTTENLKAHGTGALNIDATRIGGEGYWPAHLTLSHAPDCDHSCKSDCPVGMIDAARPDLLPSRLFFCAKATRVEREAGCEQLPHRLVGPYFNRKDQPPRTLTNSHPTVKPLALMRWLVKLVTPPGGLVLDPFTGSGTTGIAAVLEDRSFLGIERESDYVDIACARLTHWAHQATTEVP
jgi:site-specific DNA-methyltransferase (adenine-specific)